MYRPSDEVFADYRFDKEYHYSGPFKKPVSIAEHYGFRLVKPIHNSRSAAVDAVEINDNHRLASLNYYFKNKDKLSSPALICHTRSPQRKQGFFILEIFGAQHSFAEALLIRTALTILRECGNKDLIVELNSFGARDSSERFISEFSRYLRKHLSRLSDDIQHELRQNPFSFYLLPDEDETVSEIKAGAPRSIGFLSESCRNHFKGLLEYLEQMNVPYRINPHLFTEDFVCAPTLFRIVSVSKSKEEVIAHGERYDQAAAKIRRSSYPSAAIVIRLKGGKSESYKKKDNSDQPKVYFAHIGEEAKQQSLNVMELIREANISVRQALIKNSLREQLSHAEKQSIPYVIIMGVKEAQDQSVIVRHVETRTQQSIPVRQLKSYLLRVVK